MVKTVQRYDDMFSLYCKTKVVRSDFEAFALNLKTFFTGKLSTGRLIVCVGTGVVASSSVLGGNYSNLIH